METAKQTDYLRAIAFQEVKGNEEHVLLFVRQSLLSQEGTNYFFSYYDISPTLISQSTVASFIEQCHRKSAYQSYIKSWFAHSRTQVKEKVFENPVFKRS